MLSRKSLASLCGIAALLGLCLGGCPTPPTSSATGDSAPGQTKFNQSCARCHSASSMRWYQSQITNNMGSLGSSMSGITLTDQQVADLQAYIDSL